MADTTILPEGIRFFPKHEKAPDFVLGTMIITPNALYAWLKANPSLLTEYNGEKQIKLQLLNSKAGKLYAAVDTYKAEPKSNYSVPASEERSDDLPF
jgi:hypothetical protein